MPRYQKTHDELLLELSEQVQALRASMRGYDEQHLWEAKRIATVAYNLLHHATKGSSKSLLVQLGIRNKRDYVSSIIRQVDRTKPYWSSANWLVYVEMHGNSASFIPKLDGDAARYRRLAFQDWYEEPIFQAFASGNYISRKNLIHYLRSQDGGSHVDAWLTNEDYYNWKMFGDPSLSFEQKEDGVAVFGPLVDLRTGKAVPEKARAGNPILNGPLASMRQIAWELDYYLKDIGY